MNLRLAAPAVTAALAIALGGLALAPTAAASPASYGSTTGTFEQGFVDGTYIEFVIAWSNGSKGRYIGSLGADRRLGGVSTDLAHPESQATWASNRTF